MTQTVTLGTSGLTQDEVVAVARHSAKVVISTAALDAMAKTRAHIERLAISETPVYGISTGFGALANRHIDIADRVQLQKSLIRSHAAGMGAIVETEVTRALMLLRLKTMCTGRTGVRPELAETYAAILNANITPIVHEFGSLGCSGDLAPLAHCAMVAMGEGRAFGADGIERPVAELLAAANITPVELREKEGLALINGTDGMLGMLILAIHDLEKLNNSADVIAAMSVEALLGTDKVFRPELHFALRPHAGQAYSLRCAPQVSGAVRDSIAYAKSVAENELASAIDNPVVLESGEVTSNGNFHGAPVGYVLDFLAITATDLGSISERRTDNMLDKARSFGLPPFLAGDAGVDSGMMIGQYTAAGLVSENKRLAVPASVDSIPTSAMQEDHVSMGWHAARKLRRVVDNLRMILAIEWVSAGRALDSRAPLKPAKVTGEWLAKLRTRVAGVGPDRFLAPELQAAADLLS